MLVKIGAIFDDVFVLFFYFSLSKKLNFSASFLEKDFYSIFLKNQVCFFN